MPIRRKLDRDLTGAVVAVTGGARGVGLAVAEVLVREGARVAIGDLDEAAARRAAEGLGGGAIGLELDVADRDSFAGFLGEVEGRLGAVGVLINNAGIMLLGRFDEEDDERTGRQLAVNLGGVVNGVKLALPGMLRRGSGHIVNVASAAGRVPVANGASYAASKGAVVNLTHSIHAELEGSPVEISVVLPAMVDTPLAAGLPATRGVPVIEVEAVAEAILGAVKRPRLYVWVPRWLGLLSGVMALLPLPVSRAATRMVKADRALIDVDPAARSRYEDEFVPRVRDR